MRARLEQTELDRDQTLEQLDSLQQTHNSTLDDLKAAKLADEESAARIQTLQNGIANLQSDISTLERHLSALEDEKNQIQAFFFLFFFLFCISSRTNSPTHKLTSTKPTLRSPP
jgi:DNA repair exonuclease SbcCD ATPase subunit